MCFIGGFTIFDFALYLHLMRDILEITYELSEAFKRKEQDIVNAMKLIEISKQRWQNMRDNGSDSLLVEVSLFCNKHNVVVSNVDHMWIARGRSRRTQEATNLHHYRVELFHKVIDMQLQELNDRFTEVNTKLLLCMASLSPNNAFSAFSEESLIAFAEFYPDDFSAADLMELKNQLQNYTIDMQSDTEFSELYGIGDLAQKMVKKKKDMLYLWFIDS